MSETTRIKANEKNESRPHCTLCRELVGDVYITHTTTKLPYHPACYQESPLSPDSSQQGDGLEAKLKGDDHSDDESPVKDLESNIRSELLEQSVRLYGRAKIDDSVSGWRVMSLLAYTLIPLSLAYRSFADEKELQSAYEKAPEPLRQIFPRGALNNDNILLNVLELFAYIPFIEAMSSHTLPLTALGVVALSLKAILHYRRDHAHKEVFDRVSREAYRLYHDEQNRTV